MLTAVLTGLFIQTAALLGTALVGLGWIPVEAKVAKHMELALISAVLCLLVQTVVIFYTLATGRRARDLIASGVWAEGETEESKALTARIKDVKKNIFPVSGMLVVSVLITFWGGGAVHTLRIPAEMHLTMALITLGLLFASLILGFRWLPQNEAILDEAWFRYEKYESLSEENKKKTPHHTQGAAGSI